MLCGEARGGTIKNTAVNSGGCRTESFFDLLEEYFFAILAQTEAAISNGQVRRGKPFTFETVDSGQVESFCEGLPSLQSLPPNSRAQSDRTVIEKRFEFGVVDRTGGLASPCGI